MKRLHVFQLAFNTLEMVQESLRLFDEQKPDYPMASKTLVDCRWPEVASETEHSLKLHELAVKYGFNYVRPSDNFGMAGNYNWLIRELNLGEGDVIFCLDADARIQQPKYLDAAMTVFNNAPEVFTVQMNRPEVYAMNLPRFERQVAGVNIIEYHSLVAWSSGLFDCGWLKKSGGMKEGTKNYGWVEAVMERLLCPLGGKWVLIKDFYDCHLKSDSENYTKWKLEAIKGGGVSFSDWLKSVRV